MNDEQNPLRGYLMDEVFNAWEQVARTMREQNLTGPILVRLQPGDFERYVYALEERHPGALRAAQRANNLNTIDEITQIQILTDATIAIQFFKTTQPKVDAGAGEKKKAGGG